jgi:hypothetical protein
MDLGSFCLPLRTTFLSRSPSLLDGLATPLNKPRPLLLSPFCSNLVFGLLGSENRPWWRFGLRQGISPNEIGVVFAKPALHQESESDHQRGTDGCHDKNQEERHDLNTPCVSGSSDSESSTG